MDKNRCVYPGYFTIANHMAHPIRFPSKIFAFYKMEVTWMVQTAEELREKTDYSKNSDMSTPFCEDMSKVVIVSQGSRLLRDNISETQATSLFASLSPYHLHTFPSYCKDLHHAMRTYCL